MRPDPSGPPRCSIRRTEGARAARTPGRVRAAVLVPMPGKSPSTDPWMRRSTDCPRRVRCQQPCRFAGLGGNRAAPERARRGGDGRAVRLATRRGFARQRGRIGRSGERATSRAVHAHGGAAGSCEPSPPRQGRSPPHTGDGQESGRPSTARTPGGFEASIGWSVRVTGRAGVTIGRDDLPGSRASPSGERAGVIVGSLVPVLSYCWTVAQNTLLASQQFLYADQLFAVTY